MNRDQSRLKNMLADNKRGLGKVISKILEGAVDEIDGCGGEHDYQDQWSELTPDLKECWPELKALFFHHEASIRISACEAFGGLADAAWSSAASRLGLLPFQPRIVELLLTLPLEDLESGVRLAAVDVAARTPCDKTMFATTELAQLLLCDSSEEVRALCVRAIFAHAGADAAKLVSLVHDDESPLVEEALLEGLIPMGDSRARAVLVRRLSKTSPYPSADVIKAIKQCPLEDASEILLLLLAPDSPKECQTAAAEVIIEYVDESCIDALHQIYFDGGFGSHLAALALTRLGSKARHPNLACWFAPLLEDVTDDSFAGLYLPMLGLGSAFPLLLASAGQDSAAEVLMSALLARERLLAKLERSEKKKRKSWHPPITKTWFPHVSWAFAIASLGNASVLGWLVGQVEMGAPNACLSLGQLADSASLATLSSVVQAPLETVEKEEIETQTCGRRDAALAIASIDPDQLDEAAFEAMARGWPTKELTNQTLLIFAVRTLAQRLAARERIKESKVERCIEVLEAVITGLEVPLHEAIVRYRGHGHVDNANSGYVFVIRDWLDEAKMLLG